MAEYSANNYKVSITAPYIEAKMPNTYKVLEYNYILEIPVFLGWKKAANKDLSAIMNNQDTATGLLLQFNILAKSGNNIQPNYIESQITVHNKHHYYTESSLIQELERLGIGRPSTYALLVETIQDRGYVKCKDLDGITLKCEEYKLVGQILEKRILEKTFGKEKNKLVIQPTGILCIEFLIKHFNQLFSYDYTKNMENSLDKITTQESSVDLCAQCNDSIQELIKPVAKIEKQQYKIDDNNFLVFNQYGASIKQIAAGKDTVYLPVKKTLKLDLDKLKRGEYSLDDLLEFEHANLGKYKDQDLFLRIGKYGNYVEWGDSRMNIDTIGIPLKDITIEDVSRFLDKSHIANCQSDQTNNQDEKGSVNIPDLDESTQENNPDKEFSRINHPSNKLVLRTLDSKFSIRKGKFGNYVYYKTSKMKTPEFYNIKDFSKTCNVDVDQPINALTSDAKIVIEWLKTTYKIDTK